VGGAGGLCGGRVPSLPHFAPKLFGVEIPWRWLKEFIAPVSATGAAGNRGAMFRIHPYSMLCGPALRMTRERNGCSSSRAVRKRLSSRPSNRRH